MKGLKRGEIVSVKKYSNNKYFNAKVIGKLDIDDDYYVENLTTGKRSYYNQLRVFRKLSPLIKSMMEAINND